MTEGSDSGGVARASVEARDAIESYTAASAVPYTVVVMDDETPRWNPTGKGLVWLQEGWPVLATHAFRVSRNRMDVADFSLCGFGRGAKVKVVSRRRGGSGGRIAKGICPNCRDAEAKLPVSDHFQRLRNEHDATHEL